MKQRIYKLSKNLALMTLLATLGSVSILTSCDDSGVDSRANKGGNYVLTSPPPTNNGLPTPTATPTPTPSTMASTAPSAKPKVLVGQVLLPAFGLRNQGSEIAALDPGEDLFTIRWKLLNEATRSVKIQTLIFSGDESGWALAEKLVELHKKGVKVELIVDAASNPKLKDHLLYAYLNSNGVIVYGYEATILSFLYDVQGDSSLVDVIHQYHPVQHEKIFLVDSEVPDRATAVIGGSNVQNGYFFFTDGKDKVIVDHDVVLRGEIVQDLKKVFDANALRVKNLPANSGTTDTSGIWKTIELFRKTTGVNLSLPIIKPNQNAAITQKINQAKSKNLLLNWETTVDSKIVYSQPLLQSSSIHVSYLEQIARATVSIDLCNAYLILDDVMIEALRRAALDRGVKVRILTNSTESSDFKYIPLAARELYVKLIKNIPSNLIQIFEWKGSLSPFSVNAFLHSKYAVFDSETAFIGSYNLDPRSQFLNSEINLETKSDRTVSLLAADFEASVQPARAVHMTEIEINKTTKAYSFSEILQRLIGTTFAEYL